MNKYIKILSIFTFIILNACASYKTKYKVENFSQKLPNGKIKSTFYLIGDAGGAQIGTTTKALKALKQTLDTVASKNTHLIFLGDNIYPSGLPDKKSSNRNISSS